MSSTSAQIFVIMPFGDRPAGPTHSIEVIPFDRVYNDIIRPVGERAGLQVLRIDEVRRPGRIADQYLRELFQSELVIADISLANSNVFYELGIRQAISTGRTILIALLGSDLPFDIRGQRVLFYDISTLAGVLEARNELAHWIAEPLSIKSENPIREFLESIGAVSSPQADLALFEQDLRGRIERARTANQLIAIWHWVRHLSPLPALPLITLAERLADHREWAVACDVLKRALETRPNDFEIHRQLGWYLRHRGSEFEAEARSSLERALELNPSDPESLGMLGGLFKRQGDFVGAATHYARGASIAPNNLYMRVTQAAMEILSKPEFPERGLQLYSQLFTDLQGLALGETDEWTEIVRGEAAFVTGKDDIARHAYAQAFELCSTANNLLSSAEQIELLGQNGFRSTECDHMSKWIRKLVHVELDVKEPETPMSTGFVPALPVIIHLSDIHFGSRIDPNGKRAWTHRFYDGEYSRTLSDHLITEFSSPRRHFTQEHQRFYLVVSGDLTYTASTEEFRQAQQFLEDVCAGLDIPKERVIIAPGNHDVNWDAGRVNVANRFDNYVVFLSDFYGDNLFRELYPTIQWDLRINTKRPDPSELVMLRAFSDARLVFAALNSCVYETDQNHYGFIGGKQLRHIEALVDQQTAPRDSVRVAVFHHHLHPFPEVIDSRKQDEIWMDLSTIRDAGLVERWLERLGFDLVLHGHKHKSQLRQTMLLDVGNRIREADQMIICGAGSCGVESHALEHNRPNHYEVIEVLRVPRATHSDFIRVEWRELALSSEADWVTPDSWVIQG